MSTNVWNPWDDMLSLRDAMNQLVAESYVRPAANGLRGNLALDMFEDADNVEVTATLPGLDPDDVDITVQGDVLMIRGQHKQEAERKQGNYHLRERRVGSVARAVQLPCAVQADKAAAEFRNGVLHLTLPKAEAVKPRQIPIRPTQGQMTSGANGNGSSNGQRHEPIEGESRPAAQPAGAQTK